MAGQISHIIAGEDALIRAFGRAGRGTPAPLGASGAASAYFRLGCQGPDIFYHNQRTMPSGLSYGSLAHRRGLGTAVASFASALFDEERSESSPAGAYLLGLAAHAALDRATHPFIVYFSGWAEPSKPETASRRGCHPFLERLLDMALLRAARGITASEFGLSALARPEDGGDSTAASDARIASLWASALRAAYPRRTAGDSLLERRAANAILDSRYFYAATDPAADGSGFGRERWSADIGREEGLRLVALLYPREQPAGLDAANEARRSWEHPAGDGRSSSASYFDLVEEGTAEAARAIAAVLDSWAAGGAGGAASAAIAAAIGDGCLSVGDLEGRAVAPRLSRPLPLPEAMEAEYRRRVAARLLGSARRRDPAP